MQITSSSQTFATLAPQADPQLQPGDQEVTNASPWGEAIQVNISEQARSMSAQSGAGPTVDLPDILVNATRFDGTAWVKLRSFKPWTPETEQQYNQYMSGRLAMAERAFDLVNDALSTSGLDLNNPAQKEVYETVSNTLWLTAYKAMANETAFVNGPGSDDMIARDFITALRNTSIVIKGGNYAVPGEFEQLPAGKGRLDIYAKEVAKIPGNLKLATNSVLFHELGHAVAPGRADATRTWNSFVSAARGTNPGITVAQLETAYATSQARTALEARTSARGWGLSEIAGIPFNPNVDQAGSAPR